MDKQAACTGHNIACIRHKTHTIPSVHSVYFSDLIAGVIGHMQAVEAPHPSGWTGAISSTINSKYEGGAITGATTQKG